MSLKIWSAFDFPSSGQNSYKKNKKRGPRTVVDYQNRPILNQMISGGALTKAFPIAAIRHSIGDAQFIFGDSSWQRYLAPRFRIGKFCCFTFYSQHP